MSLHDRMIGGCRRTKLLSVKDTDDIEYFVRAGAKVIGHLFDFRPKVDDLKLGSA